MNVYELNGYQNRREYLESLAEEYGLEFKEVAMVAALLGSEEDFDGLVTYIEDYANMECHE